MAYETVKCCICGLEILPKENKNREHEPPLSRGGQIDNWQWAHKVCNAVKSNLTMPEFTPIAQIRYVHAYYDWHLTRSDRAIIRRIYPTLFPPIRPKERER